MTDWSLAFRNVWRNTRRTAATVMAVALSCAGLMLFGGYITWAHLSAEMHTVTLSGHVQVFRKGFAEKGAGNPAGHALADFEGLRRLFLEDPVLGPQVELVSGQLIVQGIITCADRQTSTTFAGVGTIAGDIERILRWNPNHLTQARDLEANHHLFASGPELAADDPDGITIGAGLARVLGVTHADLAAAERPSLDLAALPPAGGLPNMVSGGVRQISIRAMEEIDNRLVVMPLSLANELLFPGEPLHVTSVVVLLRSINGIPAAQQRIAEIARERGLEIEQRTCWELNPNHQRSLGIVDMFFWFAFCIVSVVLVFTIYNTVMMGIVERTREIGAIRAMGVTRRGIIAMFVQEGIVLGLIGGAAGVALGLVVAWAVNRSMILYTPPFFNVRAKLEVLCLKSPGIVLGSFLSCFLIALTGAFFPARRASHMEIAEALRH